jgi:hypothetical protein
VADLGAQLVLARDAVQTFAAGLRLLDDVDLVPLPSDRPRVSGSATPPAPWNGDGAGLGHHLLVALRQAHDAAMVLCDIDVCDDPLPWIDPPEPGDPDAPAWTDPDPQRADDHAKGIDARRAIPPLADIRVHLEHLDAALADVQANRDQLVLGDIVTALHAIDLLLRPERDGGQLVHPRWHRMAKRARYECERCGNLAGRSTLCQPCRLNHHRCAGVGDIPCDRMVPQGHTRCGACRTRLSRMTHREVREAS